MKKSEVRSPLAIVRGLGSAKSGTDHFIHQRVTAIALIPLTWWFISSLMKIALSPDSDKLVHWLSAGFNAGTLIVLLIALFYHAKLGVQTIIEDYIHCHCVKITALLINYFVMFAFTAISVLAVLKLHFHTI